PLATEQVAQYVAADQAKPRPLVTNILTGYRSTDPDVVTLTPFEVQTASDTGYSGGNTMSGGRIGSKIQIAETVTHELREDFALVSLDEIAAFSSAPQQPTLTTLLDDLSLGTVIDPATVRRIVVPLGGFPRAHISQERAGRSAPPTLVARFGDEGFAAMALRVPSLLAGDQLPVLAVFSWTNAAHPQFGAFLDANRTFGDSRVGATVQMRELETYGVMRLLRGKFERRLGAGLHLETTLAWHELKRDDPAQFRLGSPANRYDGLGFFNLDLLTAETRRLSDVLAHVRLSGEIRRSDTKHVWSVGTLWHQQQSMWLTPSTDPSPASRRTNLALDLDYRGTVAGGRLEFDALFGTTAHRTPHTTIQREATRRVAFGATWKTNQILAAFARLNYDETLPWLSTGRWQTAGTDLVAIAPQRETRAGGQLGLSVETTRLNGFVGFFHERISDHSYRDWSRERDEALSSGLSATGTEVTPHLRLAVWPEFTRRGWMGVFDFNPSRVLALRASWSHDWEDNGAYRGGHRRASLAARHTIRVGALRGFTTGLALTYRERLVFDDGYTLEGGLRVDALLAYRFLSGARRETLLQLNAGNLARRPWQPTRFAPDQGPILRLGVSRGF
ncbi:MAG: hypothetical protein ABIR80_10235, partial [Opitutaceae bacterium]